MFCPNCGKKVEDGSVFCDNCGNRLQPNAPTSVPKVSAPKMPAPKASAPKMSAPKMELPKINKQGLISTVLYLVLAALYTGISILLISLINIPETLTAISIYDNDITATFTLKEFLELLINGNELFHPTILSSALAIAFYIFLYSVPVFGGLALIFSLINKRAVFFNVTASIFASVSALFTVLIAPISLKFVPNLIQVLSLNIGMIVSDIEKVTFIPLILYSAAVLAMVTGTIILTNIIGKRRTK